MKRTYANMKRRQRIEAEALEMGEWLVDHKCTIRQLAKEFCTSRQTAYTRIEQELKYIDGDLYKRCRTILDQNKADCPKRMQMGRSYRRGIS